MSDKPQWYPSKTNWLSMISAAAFFAALAGYGLSEEHQGALAESFTALAAALAGMAALIGQIKAGK